MSQSTIIYYGDSGLCADILDAYFCNLHLRFEHAEKARDLLTCVQRAPQPVVVLSLNEPPSSLMQLARELISDPSNAFPHIFILYDGEPFDAQLEAVTVITGASKLSRLAAYIGQLERAWPAVGS